MTCNVDAGIFLQVNCLLLKRGQVGQLESVLIARQASVKRQMSDLGEKLKKVREETKHEV